MPELSTSSPSLLESQESDRKIREIRLACEASDLDAIRKLALSQAGLVNDSLRCTACRCCCRFYLEALRTDCFNRATVAGLQWGQRHGYGGQGPAVTP